MIMDLFARGRKLSVLCKAGMTLLLASFICLPTIAQKAAAAAPAPLDKPLLVGYLQAMKSAGLADSMKSLDLSRMTDIDLAFGDPPKCIGVCTAKSDMTFLLQGQTGDDIDKAVDEAHAAGVKVLLSIGGGGGDQQIIQFYNVGLTAPLVASLNKFVQRHHLDGVDLDIEDPSNMGAPYATFASALFTTFHPEGKLVTAAVAKYLQGSMPGAVLHQFDFLNIMNYSSYANAVQALHFYEQDENISRSKLVLGVPFFGSNDNDTREENYNKILAAYPNAWKVDIAGGGTLDDGQAFHYVGEQTMAQETQLGKEYGGIMIWEMQGDAAGPHSLLMVIEKGLERATPHAQAAPCTTLARTK
ncbi:MAG: glycosyl hydrolase family 18 protein [Acidobacteriaceae bacterium]